MVVFSCWEVAEQSLSEAQLFDFFYFGTPPCLVLEFWLCSSCPSPSSLPSAEVRRRCEFAAEREQEACSLGPRSAEASRNRARLVSDRAGIALVVRAGSPIAVVL